MKKKFDDERYDKENIEKEKIKYQVELEKLKILNEANILRMEEYRNKEEEYERQRRSLEQDSILLKTTIECVSKTRDDLEEEVHNCHSRIDGLVVENSEARGKVGEVLDLVERVVAERDGLAVAVSNYQAEQAKVKILIKQLLDDAENKRQTDVQELQINYNKEKQKIQTIKEENTKLHEELEDITNKYKQLTNETNIKLSEEKMSFVKGKEMEVSGLENALDLSCKESATWKNKYEELEKNNDALKDEIDVLKERKNTLDTNELQANLEKYGNSETKERDSKDEYIQQLENHIQQLKQTNQKNISNFKKALENIEININKLKTQKQSWKVKYVALRKNKRKSKSHFRRKNIKKIIDHEKN